jgi:hypothetical protein
LSFISPGRVSRGKVAKSQPAARHPKKKPSIEALMAERDIVRATIAGIPRRDRSDVAALRAWLQDRINRQMRDVPP